MVFNRLVGLLAVGVGVLSSACVVEEHHSAHRAPPSTDQDAPSQPASEPMLVVVDTDKTMDAKPGQGVGVFVEYETGGGWTVVWTCDTVLSGRTCDVSLGFSTDGAITAVNADAVPGGYVAQPATNRLDVATTTGTELHAVRFQTAPGAVVTLDARVGGLDDGSFLFFVQDGQVKGGYAGTLTNPLRFQGKTP